MARCTGLKKDLRLSKNNNYSGYNYLNVKSFLGINGDTYDRYLIRMLEMGESLNIINNITFKLLNLKQNKNLIYQNLINKKININNKNSYVYMEDLINHFIN
jgi:NADH-quinone oxidoreductase subunit D